MNQILPSKEVENRSLSKLKSEMDSLSGNTTVYHSVGKMYKLDIKIIYFYYRFLASDIESTHKMVDSSIETNKRALSILLERKSVLEKSLKEAEEKHKFYLSKLGESQ